MRVGKFMTAALMASVLEYHRRRRVFAGATVDGTWPYTPRVSQKKRRLIERRCG